MDRRFPIEEFEAERFEAFFGKEIERLHASLLAGGACNSNYFVETSKKEKFVCRIHKRGNPRTEKKITQNLQGIVPVPSYLWETEGLSVIEYIEGEHFAPSEQLVREAGRIIGRLNNISFERSGEIKPSGEVVAFEGWESYQKGLLSLLRTESAAHHLPKETISTLEEILNQHSSILESFDLCQNLVHGDFRPDNILVAEDRIVGVIDWEFSHSGCSYMDIGNLLRHLGDSWSDDLAIGLMEEGFDLPEDWRFRASLIDLTSHLEFLTSGRSAVFKQTCVDRIQRLIQRNTEQGESGQLRSLRSLRATS